ncbi:antigen 5 like allergen Cul n 1-like [Anopheles nili]|uniref:antigen 5 like allergen Cul n 1-like n=1 Tax=Anopheles nili TaxID=185578 RepID=UPI00237C148F|nr:antigen 5 like allergen Cul n 1-like [Anopheles nili]
MSRFVLTCLIILSIVRHSVTYHSRYDFCDKNICPPGKRNIGCGCIFSESYGPACAGKNAKLHKLTKYEKEQVLKMHNEMRNTVACGKLAPFPPAVRMVQLRIDVDLETLAECNVKTCKYGHDQCRNTDIYHYAGQNIAKRTVCGRELKFTEVLNSSIHVWYAEHADANIEMLSKYPSHELRKPIGHFTLIVNDNVFFIGCALISYSVRINDYFEETGEECRAYYFVCNYSFINLKGKATYNPGKKPASYCRTSKNKEHPCLCKVSEPYSTMLDWETKVE